MTSGRSERRGRRRGLPRSLAVLGVLALVVAGCNSILDNKPATLDPAALSTEGDAASSTPVSITVSDGSATVEGETGTSECPANTHLCRGACVPSDDPLYGCGSPSCQPCNAAHGSAKCEANGCAIAACDDGHADCNHDPHDGCEVDLSKAATCGSCTNACPAGTPLCAPEGAEFGCTNGCKADAPLKCGTECVSPLTSANHCGGCDKKCADVPNALVSCAGGNCTFACKAGFHECGGGCVSDNDPGACGANCVPCPAIANGAAACQANICGAFCKVGFGDCNNDIDDGCEAQFATDVLNCGGCKNACPSIANAHATCLQGQCGSACDTGYHACGNNNCAANNDPAACGAACTVCPTGPNATPTCSSNTCGLRCDVGRGNCNQNATDGCEINFANDALNCGGCNNKCSDIANAQVSCVQSACTFACDTGYHACGGKCAGNTDPTACGASCTVCPTAPNATATCQSNTCGLQCNVGRANCNQNATDGCEVNLTNDPLNCGACGTSCGGGACDNGTCTAPPAP